MVTGDLSGDLLGVFCLGLAFGVGYGIDGEGLEAIVVAVEQKVAHLDEIDFLAQLLVELDLVKQLEGLLAGNPVCLGVVLGLGVREGRSDLVYRGLVVRILTGTLESLFRLLDEGDLSRK